MTDQQRSADRLHAAGWAVVGASRRGTSPGGWQPLVMDVDDDASVTGGMAGVVAEHGRLDAVVACAGWGLAGPVEQTPIAWSRRPCRRSAPPAPAGSCW